MYDLIVIGSGPAGYVAAIRAAQLGMKVACIEKGPIGGTCLNVGCIPSKSLLQSTELFHAMQHDSEAHGIKASSLAFDLGAMMARKSRVVSQFGQGIAGLFRKNKVDSIEGVAKLLSASEVEVINSLGNKTLLQTKKILLATGSEPTALPFAPFDETTILSSTGALKLEAVPKKLLVIGAGVIGVELASVYSRLGSEVVFLEMMDRICPTFDVEISQKFQKILEKQGMSFRLSTGVTAVTKNSNGVTLTLNSGGSLTGDKVLIAVGRRAYTAGLGLENVGVALEKGRVVVDGNFQTNVPGIYAVGDIIDGPMLAHKASEEGVVLAELLAGHKSKVSYIAVPNIVYTDPEVASVGFSEEELKSKGIAYKVGKFPFLANSRAKCAGKEDGFVKVIARADDDMLLGVHIIASHASELIGSAMVAIKKRMKSQELAELPWAHPTFSEAIKEACLAVASRAIHI